MPFVAYLCPNYIVGVEFKGEEALICLPAIAAYPSGSAISTL